MRHCKNPDGMGMSYVAGIYNRYVNDLLSYGIGLGFPHELIKDAIQDVFYKLSLKPKELEKVENMKYYLFRMLKNRLLDLTKNAVRTDGIEEYRNAFSIRVTILDRMIAREDKRAVICKVEKLLDMLTDRQREAVYLRFAQDMSYEEIAQLLDITPQSARNLIFKAMRKMREQEANFLFLLLCMSFSRFYMAAI